MRVCLANPLYQGRSRIMMIPHSLLSLQAELEKHGHQADILDFNRPGDPPRIQELKSYDAVGISVMSLQLEHAIEVADSLKNHTKVVWGGVHCFLDPHSILARFPEHILVRGEGEIPLVRVLQHFEGNYSWEGLRDQSGICLWDREPVINAPFVNSDLDSLADIDFYRLPRLDRYLNQTPPYFDEIIPHLTYHAARGCHWDCSFCINSIYRKHGIRYRHKSMEKVRRETEKIIEDFDLHWVMCIDDDFFLDRKFTDEWKIYAKEKRFLWQVSARFSYFSDRLLNKERLLDLFDHGLVSVGMSIETGCEHVRNKILNKRVRDDQIQQTVKRIKDTLGDNIHVYGGFMVFFPGDTAESRILMIKWMDYLSKNINMCMNGPVVYRPYPGARLYELDKTPPVYGDLDYYIRRLSSDGSEIDRGDQYEAAFYCEIVRVFFDNRRQHFHFSVDNTGQPKTSLKPRTLFARWGSHSALRGILTSLLMVSIVVRIRLDYWRFFVEPVIIGFMVVQARRVLRFKRILTQKVKRPGQKMAQLGSKQDGPLRE